MLSWIARLEARRKRAGGVGDAALGVETVVMFPLEILQRAKDVQGMIVTVLFILCYNKIRAGSIMKRMNKMTLQAVPVTIEDGMVRSMDGSTLPQRAHAVLVILPAPSSDHAQEEWQRPFDEFFAVVQSQQFTGLDDVGDEDLNAVVHAARQHS